MYVHVSIDVDECTEGVDDCHHNATCSNTPGGFNCTCVSGFSGDGANSCEGKLQQYCHTVMCMYVCPVPQFRCYASLWN